MSRLIVKNLPTTITEEKFHEIFARYGTVTDVQLKYTPEGKFRKFGFIGYQNEAAANDALKKLHNTFIATSKIVVEKCALLGDVNKPRAWSKYSSDSSAFKKKHANDDKLHKDSIEEEKKVEKTTDQKEKTLEKYKDDPEFEDFLQAHDKGNELEKLKQNSISDINDDDDDVIKANDSTDGKVTNEPVSRGKFDLFTLKLKNLPFQIKKREIREFFRPHVPFSIRIPRKSHGIIYVGFKTEKGYKNGLLKNKSFIKGKQIFVMKHDLVAGQNNNETKSKKLKWKKQEEALKSEEEIGESGIIFIRNLSYTVTEKDVEEIFTKFGDLAEINIPIDPVSRKIKGFGTVTFMLPEQAAKAYSELDGTIFQGRMLHLLPGKSKNVPDEDNQDISFKEKKLQHNKQITATAGNWNALFLGSNAVADTIASRTKTSKSEVVGLEGKGSAAVRLALGETALVAETKKYLEEHGIVLDAFNSEPKSKSNRTIIVKNLPAETTEEEMKELFGEFGVLDKVVFPPHGIAAIIQFADPSEARKAYAKLAYSKFKYVPLFLQWAPENTFSDSANNTDHVKTTNLDVEADNISSTPTNSDILNKEEEKSDKKSSKATKQTGSKILVKNVPFEANKKEIKELFSAFGEIKALRLPKKMGDSMNSHRGFAFVDYTNATDAKVAFDALSQSTHLLGRRLVLEWAATEEAVEDIRKRTADHFNAEVSNKKFKKSIFKIN